MTNKISAIIISNEEHDTNEIVSYKFSDVSETHFDIKMLHDSLDIKNVLNNFRGVDAIIVIGDADDSKLYELPIEDRKKWVHLDEWKPIEISNAIINVFLGNINRTFNTYDKTFSIFTCAFNTKREDFYRLYNSLKSQTYNNWNWWILDDSTNEDVLKMVKEINDSHVFVIRNHTNHGSIGFNKHMIAMCCNGDYLVEVDHDDELTNNCLERLLEAFDTYKCDFVYSDAIEECNGGIVTYGDFWAYGYGENGKLEDGTEYPLTCDINSVTIRTIYSQPNHVRCWEKNFYHKIGGHNTELCILDDQDILIRTFLNGTMCHIKEVLYIQHEGVGERGEETGSSTQSKRFNEIQRTTFLLKDKYDSEIHKHVIELGHKDPVWVIDENGNEYSVLNIKHEKLPPICYILN